ncbi:peptidoglycan-associated lipoprotein Pal [Pigmentiphaga aceris]|uniref:Peptidoglycan-associated lipoprotein n=1 Tax=Pigmentiphaga aceris TaxID=1940612 RepID=A0A5C0B394_9BURK|nr:peptidoglycan-associated lipoprotein Pal [Pigmentiphaga aceris]QEI08143.1 peptidoglycan-associated lipoprotein Pal [Pigmentiphaga aceris]
MFQRILRTLTIAGLAAVLAACGSNVKLDDANTTAPVENRSGANASGANGRAVAPVDASRNGLDPLNDPRGVLAQRSVYFDFDSYVVSNQYKALVENHARFLVQNPSRRISVEGHTDDRGGSEYNLALGQRRSEAVRRALVLLGVRDDQIEAVSFGKEKPKAAGSDEASFAENRRADIVYR